MLLLIKNYNEELADGEADTITISTDLSHVLADLIDSAQIGDIDSPSQYHGVNTDDVIAVQRNITRVLRSV